LNDYNKIPFGLNELNNELVDVHDVPNGKKCGCICPSCSTPLESRQGGVNVWHFAHSSKKVYAKIKNECEYSFYLSLRLMARKIIGKQLTLCLPEYKGSIGYYEGIIRIPQSKEFIVTNNPNITLSEVEVEKKFSGVPVDIIGKIGTFDFVIYLTHPDRDIPEELFTPENAKCGVLNISLCSLQLMLEMAKKEDKTYQQILTDFLVNDKSSKNWVYHPNFKKLADSTINSLKINASNFTCTHIVQNNYNHFIHQDIPDFYKPQFLDDLKPEDVEIKNIIEEQARNHQSDQINNFECVICKAKWRGTNICSKCDTHLYSRKLSD